MHFKDEIDTKKNISSITSRAATTDRIRTLQELYAQVPSGTCTGCTMCCSESVNTSFLEFANIVENGLGKLSRRDFEALSKRVVSYYLLEWVKPQKCPFLNEENKCIIYDTRPLPCRIFGTQPRFAYEKNYKNIKSQNIAVAREILTEYGSMLPKNVLHRKIEFCEDYKPERLMNTQNVEALYSRLINLDGALYFEGIIDLESMNGDLVNWMLQRLIESQNDTVLTKSLMFDLKKECLNSIQKEAMK